MGKFKEFLNEIKSDERVIVDSIKLVIGKKLIKFLEDKYKQKFYVVANKDGKTVKVKNTIKINDSEYNKIKKDADNFLK